jgi:hypothetical protein
MHVAASLMMASVGSRMVGIGISSTVTLPGSCMTTARMVLLARVLVHSRYPGGGVFV